MEHLHLGTNKGTIGYVTIGIEHLRNHSEKDRHLLTYRSNIYEP